MDHLIHLIQFVCTDLITDYSGQLYAICKHALEVENWWLLSVNESVSCLFQSIQQFMKSRKTVLVLECDRINNRCCEESLPEIQLYLFSRNKIVRRQSIRCPVVCEIECGVPKYSEHSEKYTPLNFERVPSTFFNTNIFVGTTFHQGGALCLSSHSIIIHLDGRF